MPHITADQLYAITLDKVTPAKGLADHLALCPQCHQELNALSLLVRDFEVARQSQPTPRALQSYAGLYEHVQKRTSLLEDVRQTLVAVLTWDSRQQFALQGVRSAAAITYRLLYTTPRAELELMVEPNQQLFRIQGELLALDTGDTFMPALVEFLDSAAFPAYTAETDGRGHFHLDQVIPGTYRLLVTPSEGVAIEVEEVEIG